MIQTGLIPACLCGNSHSSFLYWARGRALWIDIWASLLFLTASPAQSATLTSPQVVKTETSAPEGVRIGFEEDIDTIAALLPETQVIGSSEPLQVVLPAKTPVLLRLEQAVGSKISRTGDSFAFVVAQAVELDGVTVLPAGTPGTGEVVHAKKGGGSGSGGELVLSAGYFDLGEAKLPLRSIRMTGGVEDRIGLATAIGIAPIVGVLGFAVKGKEIEYQPGFIAEAMTAQAHTFLFASQGAPAGDAISDLGEGEGP